MHFTRKIIAMALKRLNARFYVVNRGILGGVCRFLVQLGCLLRHLSGCLELVAAILFEGEFAYWLHGAKRL